jgi:hypothetical protein
LQSKEIVFKINTISWLKYNLIHVHWN